MMITHCNSIKEESTLRNQSAQQGFTLLELAVAMAVSAVVLLGIYASQTLQQDTFRNQTMVVDAQQNLRGALTLIQQDLVMAGYDRNDSGNFGITSIVPINNNGSIQFTGDFGDGTEADNGTVGAGETIDYYLWDSPNTSTIGNIDLCRQVDGGTQNLMAPGIEALGMAYAYDNDGDGELDRYNGAVIWAIDSDGDNDLDRLLDDNADGVIDVADTPGGVSLTGLGLADDIPPVNIRAVRIWLLARTEGAVRGGYTDPQTYVIAARRLTPADNFQRRLLTSTIHFRNIGL
jgi:type IV pilus assembly protein PilW